MRPGVTDPRRLDEVMSTLGAPLRHTRAIPAPHRYTINAVLGRLESNQSAATWRLDDATRQRAAAATRAWAAGRYGDLDEPRTEDAEITWRVYQRA
jgi:hypothetical protein